MSKERHLRRSGARIMGNLILLLGSLSYIMVLAVLNGTVGFLCAMGVPFMGALGVVKAMGEPIPLSYGLIVTLAILFGVVRGLLRYVEQYSNHYIAFRLLAVIRDRIFEALRKLCPAKLESKQKGAIIAMITADIETLEVFYAHTISPICIALIVSAFVVGFVSWISSPYLALAAMLGFILVGIVLPVRYSGSLKESGVAYRSAFSSFNAFFLDSIKGIKDIVLHNAGEARKTRVNERSDALLEQTRRTKRGVTRAMAQTEFCVSLILLATLILGLLLVIHGRISSGRMILGVVAVLGSFGPVLAISALPGDLTQTFASGDRVLNLLSEKPAVEPIEDGADFDFEDLDVQHLSFAYDEKMPVLCDLNMRLKKGEIVGIVGDSGCGKSTFLKLLMRFWEKDEGKILYNGTDIDRVNTQSLLDHVTMVSQTTYLFDDTIEQNLRLAKPDATTEEIKEACQMASVHDFILTLPEGYQTRVGTLGDRLSAGEKQRIGLARAFLRGSELILLDEPTSNVDAINEGIILRALKAQKHKRSILLVSHRESTMAIADRIYRVEGGKMIPWSQEGKKDGSD